MVSWIPLLPELRVPYSTRISGRRDEVICVRDNSGTQKATGQSAHRGRAGCWCVVVSGGVLGWAWESFLRRWSFVVRRPLLSTVDCVRGSGERHATDDDY
jgi:hypothetical protein